MWPEPAYAWGPAAHLDFGLQMLRGTFVIAPIVRTLIARHATDYLYGCIAADIVVGKNRAQYVDHCHNWQNGLRLLDAARTDARRALAWGFLSHLGADIVAHNYFVPFKTVESYRGRATRHAYWELRFDRVAHDNERVWDTFSTMKLGRYRDHDGFLQDSLPGRTSRLFSFRMSRRVFISAMTVMRLERWRATMRHLASRSRLHLHAAEVSECNGLAVRAIESLLREGEHSRTVTADPVGRDSLLAAKRLRATLRTLRSAGRLDEARWTEALPVLRRCFHDSIYAPLELPDVAELVARA